MKKVTPFVNLGMGTIIALNVPGFFNDETYLDIPGIYLTCTGGFKHKHFQFHAGINMRTHENTKYNYGNQLY